MKKKESISGEEYILGRAMENLMRQSSSNVVLSSNGYITRHFAIKL